jgi:hypothetical protein
MTSGPDLSQLIPSFIMIDPLCVMAGLVPAIHVWFCAKKVVDGRDKHGHDDSGITSQDS